MVVVAGAAVVVVFAGGNAVIDQDREERAGHIAGVQALDDVIAGDFDVDKVPHLALKGSVELIEAGELGWVAGFEADLLPGAWIDTVVQRDLKHFGHVEIAGQVVVFLAEGADLHTAAGAALAGIAD